MLLPQLSTSPKINIFSLVKLIMLSLLDIFENDETEQNNENQRGCFNFSIFLSFVN
jgi:hypothetical protein